MFLLCRANQKGRRTTTAPPGSWWQHHHMFLRGMLRTSAQHANKSEYEAHLYK
jgi:hypothetical protein